MRIRTALLPALLAAACREQPLPSVAPARLARQHADTERTLLALVPAESPAGEAFQRLADGNSALAVIGTGFSPSDEIAWQGRRLTTTFGSSRLLTAVVPSELLVRPGTVEVSVESPGDARHARLSATFRILPRCAFGAAAPATRAGGRPAAT